MTPDPTVTAVSAIRRSNDFRRRMGMPPWKEQAAFLSGFVAAWRLLGGKRKRK